MKTSASKKNVFKVNNKAASEQINRNQIKNLKAVA